MSRFTTGTCAKSTRLRCGSPRFVFMPRRQNTMRRLPPDATYSQALSDSSSVMPMPRLNSTGSSVCCPTALSSSKFCALRVPIWSITPVALPDSRERLADLVDVRLVRHLHRDDADAVLAGELEHEGQAVGPVALEVVGAGARLVGARARGDDAVLLAARRTSPRRSRGCRPRTGPETDGSVSC